MIKTSVKHIFYIFIYITISLLTGCTDNWYHNAILASNEMEEEVCETDYFLSLSSYLPVDENGYYQIETLDGYNQTFTTLTAETGSYNSYQKVGWISDTEVELNSLYWQNCVNSSSYTDGEGKAHSVFSAWEILVNDTVKVYAGYHDECDNHYVDSLNIIILGD